MSPPFPDVLAKEILWKRLSRISGKPLIFTWNQWKMILLSTKRVLSRRLMCDKSSQIPKGRGYFSFLQPFNRNQILNTRKIWISGYY